MSRHIHGPWTAGETANGTPTVSDSGGGNVCGFHWGDKPRRMAAARLIAAAPELLAALELARKQLGKLTFKDSGVSAAMEAAGRAIAKATGEVA